MSIDRVDRKILSILQKEGRISNHDLANKVDLSPSPCLRRVRQLEKQGIIKSYVALVDQAALKLGLTVFVSVSLDKQDDASLQRFESEVRSFDEVMECYLMTGDMDYLLRVVFHDVDAFDHFLRHKLTQVSGIAKIKSSLALQQIHYKTELPMGMV